MGDAEGLLVIDKPVGPTSHDVVAQLRRAFSTRRVGHGGTLDPPASGVLLVGLGRATRLLRYLLDLEKSYTAELVLGVATTTLDDTGAVVEEKDMSGVSAAEVLEAGTHFVGPISQIPPMVSAVQVGGKRLHELARAGVEVERRPRSVVVHALELTPGSSPLSYRMALTCSSGTYVRSIAADIGTTLGGVAHLRGLRRTAIGPFEVADAVAPERAGAGDLLPAAAIVGHLRSVTVDDDLLGSIATGRVLERRTLALAGEGPWALLDGAGRLAAVYEVHSPERVKPAVVLAGPEGRPQPGSN